MTSRCPSATSCTLPVPEGALCVVEFVRTGTVIAIDGACSNNGKTGARSSTGVFFGESNARNRGCTLDQVERHTNQIAELKACVAALTDALRILWDWYQKKEQLGAVVIKSDSAYVVRGVVEWLTKWKANGWTNSRGLPVANQELFRAIKERIELLEEYKVIVKLWLVPREMNQMADRLAKLALENGISGESRYSDV